MQLYLIRHAQSTNNALWSETGGSEGRVADPELTAIGRIQARYLARFLSGTDWRTAEVLDAHDQNVEGFHLTHLYASLMIRSLDTASIVADALGLEPVAHPDTHETGGIWLEDEETEARIGLAGPNRAFFENRWPHVRLPETLGEAGWWNERPYEDYDARINRAEVLLKDLQATHGPEDRVALITHGAFYNYFLRYLLGIPAEKKFWFALNNVGMSRIDFTEREMRLTYQNRLDFLPPELIT